MTTVCGSLEVSRASEAGYGCMIRRTRVLSQVNGALMYRCALVALQRPTLAMAWLYG